MRNFLKIKKLFLYKSSISELKSIDCRLPIGIDFITNENTFKVLNFRDKIIENCFKYMVSNKEIGIYGILDNHAIAHAWCIINDGKGKKKMGPFYKTKSKIAYIFFCNVKEEFRGNNIYPYLLYNLIKIVNEKYNIDTFYGDIDFHNIASQKGAEKIGFRLYKRCKFIIILNHVINKYILK